jgi:chromosomal replication initiator protein
MDGQLKLEEQPDFYRLKKAFERAKERVAETIPPMQAEKFLKPLELEQRCGRRVYISAPGEFKTTWVAEKYLPRLSRALREEMKEDLELVVEARLNDQSARDGRFSEALYSSVPYLMDEPCSRYTFENFVVSDSNRVAYEGARAVATRSREAPNPLFIYGRTGLGKTHLLRAIEREWKQDRKAGCRYVTAQQFAHEFIEGARGDNLGGFRRSFETVQVLLVDDVEFLEEKKKSQEELFFRFNEFYESGRQLVFCSDRSPRELSGLPARLRTRLESGLVADIRLPELEMRQEILRRRAAEYGVELSPEVCLLLAEAAPDNVRTLEGILSTVVAYARVGGRPVDGALVKEVIEQKFGGGNRAQITPEAVLKAVAQHFALSVEEIKGPCRRQDIVLARHLAIYIIRQHLGESWKRIGQRLGNRDHTSIIHGYRKMEKLLEVDYEMSTHYKVNLRALSLR